MSISQLFPHRGDQKDIAKLLHVTEPAVVKWFKRGYLPIKQALRMEQAFNIPAESMVEPALGTALSNRPKKRGTMKTSDPRAGQIIHSNETHATWANVSKVDALPDTYQVALYTQHLGAKNPDELQVKAQLFLNDEGLEKLINLLDKV